MTRSQALTMLRKARKPQKWGWLEMAPAERIAKRKEAKEMGLRSVKQLYFVLAYQDSGCIEEARRAAKAGHGTVKEWLKQPRVKELLQKSGKKRKKAEVNDVN